MRHLPSLLTLAAVAAACGDGRFREAQLEPAPRVSVPAVASAPVPAPMLRFSVAAVESPRDTYSAYSKLLEGIGKRLGLDVELVQRRTYREVNDLLAAGRLDAALLCTGGYLDLKRRAPGTFEIVAAPIAQGKSTYESLVIVPASSPARSLLELAGARFAFTDELSFSGRMYVLRVVSDLGRDPERFFGGTLYTQSHDRSITAVATGLVDGAAVHSGVFEEFIRRRPELAARVRVIHRSPPFGAMPVVASTRLDPSVRARLRGALLDLARDPETAEALRMLNIDGFVSPPPGLYEGAERFLEARR